METNTNPLEDLSLEQNELRKMIGEGVTFEIELTTLRRKPGFFGYFLKRQRVKEKKTFHIAEPTLNTLDRLSAVWLEMTIDEAKLNDADYMATAKKLANAEARKLAKVIAIAVLGEDYYDVTERGGNYRRKGNEARLKNLTSLFFHSLTPSEFLTLAVIITNVSNLGDFINSMRLMSATRTSDPISNRIEEQG